MTEHTFKPGDTAYITSNAARSEVDDPDCVYPELAEGDAVEVLFGPDQDGDYYVKAGPDRRYYIAPRFLAPADEPAPYYGPCTAKRHETLFPWDCENEAAEYVEVYTDRTHLMRLCASHANQAAAYSGFVSRRPLTTPRPRPVEAAKPAPDTAHDTASVDGRAAERGRITRIIRRHANGDALPLNARNALSSIVDEIEMMTEREPDPQPAPRCTYGADCQVHPDENRLHNYDGDASPVQPMPAELAARVLDLAQRVAKLEARLQGVIETHHLWDGS